MGLHDAALAHEREALRFASNTSNVRLKSQIYAYLGSIQRKVKDFDEALKNVQLAFNLAASLSSDNGRTMMAYAALQMGHIYQEAGDCDKAIVQYTQVIPVYEKNIPRQYEARKGRFLCYIHQQNDHLAQTEMSILSDLLNEHRRKLSHEDHRNTFFDVEQPVVDAAIDFEYSRRNNPERAFNYMNSARARSLSDRLEADKEVKDRVLDQHNKFETVSEPRSLQEIKDQLPEQTQVVQYVMLENKLLIWVISRNDARVEMQPISKKDVNDKLRRFLNIVSQPPKDNQSQELLLANELYEILIQPVAKFLDERKVLCIVPDGTLSYLPFAALVSPASGKYLFEERRLMTSPSASVFLKCSETASQKNGQPEEKALSVGNPAFDRAAFQDFGNLPEATKEAMAVGTLYQSTALTESLATKEAMKRDSETADVIHLALHSTVDDVAPLRSKLLLTNSVFEAWEIYNLNLSRARLVVLSSCESGAGRYYGGEGMSSFARAFISAGAPLVVASLWRVESAATETLMINFHILRRQKEMSTVDALRTAQHQMAYGPAQKTRRPYYWAAFTVTGGYAEF
jgi:CHAT domain-containing protein